MLRLSQYRAQLKLGTPPISVPTLLIDVAAFPQSMTEFRTRSSNELPAHSLRTAALASPEASLLPIEKSDRNPYGAFVFVGRGSASDVVLKHHSISKSHAWFEEREGSWLLHDNRSRNGTFVNGVRITEGGTLPVRSGATVTFGTMPAHFLMPRDLAELVR
jgi:hypothetical protein